MTFYTASFGTIMLRFYLMMLIVIVAGLTGYYILGAIVCLPILLMSMLGVSFYPNHSSAERG